MARLCVSSSGSGRIFSSYVNILLASRRRKERPKPPTACSSSEPEEQSSEMEMSGDSVSVTETHCRRIDHEEPPTLAHCRPKVAPPSGVPLRLSRYMTGMATPSSPVIVSTSLTCAGVGLG